MSQDNKKMEPIQSVQMNIYKISVEKTKAGYILVWSQKFKESSKSRANSPP